MTYVSFTSSFLFIFAIAKPFNLFYIIVDLKYVFILDKVENVLSGVAEVTGKVANNCNNNLMLGTRLVKWDIDSIAETGFGMLLVFHCCLHKDNSALSVELIWLDKSLLYILAASKIVPSSYSSK
jgi:hypothetical protein